MIVEAGANFTLVAKIDLACLGDSGAGQEADHSRVALRGRAIDGVGIGRRPGEGRRDRPANIGILVQPAQAQVEREAALAAERDDAGEVGAEHRAQRVGRLLRHVEAQRVGAPFGEGILRHRRALQARKRREAGGGGREEADAIASLDLPQELVGAGAAVGGALQAGELDLPLHLVA